MSIVFVDVLKWFLSYNGKTQPLQAEEMQTLEALIDSRMVRKQYIQACRSLHLKDKDEDKEKEKEEAIPTVFQPLESVEEITLAAALCCLVDKQEYDAVEDAMERMEQHIMDAPVQEESKMSSKTFLQTLCPEHASRRAFLSWLFDVAVHTCYQNMHQLIAYDLALLSEPQLIVKVESDEQLARLDAFVSECLEHSFGKQGYVNVYDSKTQSLFVRTQFTYRMLHILLRSITERIPKSKTLEQLEEAIAHALSPARLIVRNSLNKKSSRRSIPLIPKRLEASVALPHISQLRKIQTSYRMPSWNDDLEQALQSYCVSYPNESVCLHHE